MVNNRRVRGSVIAVAWLSLLAFGPAGAGTASAAGPMSAMPNPVVQGSLVELTRMPGNQWTWLNLTAAYGRGLVASEGVPFVDPVTGYQNAYTVDSTRHLHEYARLPAGNWSDVDLTATWQERSVGSTPGPFVDTLTHDQSVLAIGTNGDLLDFLRLADGGWLSVDATAMAHGPSVTFVPAPVVDPATGLENVYATTTTGDLVEYTRRGDGSWFSLDVTVAANALRVDGTPQPFIDPVTHFQNAYVITSTGDLIEYTRLADGKWITVDLSVAAGSQRYSIVGSPRPVVDPVTGSQRVYAHTSTGLVIEFTRQPDGTWIYLDIIGQFTGPLLNGDPVPFADGSTQALFAAGLSGQLVEYVRQPNGIWTSFEVTATFGGPSISGDPEPFVDPVTHLLNVYYSHEDVIVIDPIPHLPCPCPR